MIFNTEGYPLWNQTSSWLKCNKPTKKIKPCKSVERQIRMAKKRSKQNAI